MTAGMGSSVQTAVASGHTHPFGLERVVAEAAGSIFACSLKTGRCFAAGQTDSVGSCSSAAAAGERSAADIGFAGSGIRMDYRNW